jgi:hypothetical protein
MLILRNVLIRQEEACEALEDAGQNQAEPK